MSRIRESDVNLVRERARIDDVVRDYVNLKSAGGGSLKGLCPFHDERSASFHVTPARGYFHCFGCQESGDVFTFIRKIEGMTFVEAIEKLAAKFNVPLHYEESSAVPDKQAGLKTRLLEAHKAAAAYYVQQLATPGAETGRQFLLNRGFDSAAAAHFGVGFAPKGWDSLLLHLRQLGFKDDELLAGGLMSQGQRGIYDRFRGRLVWPIRDLAGDVVGFGARKLFDDDDGPKYLNTPETPLYKKSQVLYGVDLARKDIAKKQQAVIVEGYTDVMACHLAGITTAVATCGTAFGTDHIKVLRRLLMDSDEYKGEVIFTFDGDAAGRKAALRAFDEDQRFVSHTFVAVEPNGLDPCDLRQKGGDEAVQQLLANKVPMFEFAIKSGLSDLDLNTAEGRVAGLKLGAPIVAAIRDQALRPEYTRMLAGWLGMDLKAVQDAVAQSKGKPKIAEPPAYAKQVTEPEPVEVAPAVQERPDPRKVEHRVEREALKAVLQEPASATSWYEIVEDAAFTFLPYRRAHQAVIAVLDKHDPSEIETTHWVEAVMAAAADDTVRTTLSALIVEPLNAAAGESMERYVTGVIAKLQELDASRRIADLKGRLQRSDAEGESAEQAEIFDQLLALETHRRALADHARGL
jgi:DNA primase